MREVLVALAESSFEVVPPNIEVDIHLLVRGWRSSVPCENGFKILQAGSAAHSANFLGRTSRWHRLTTSGPLADHDRKRVQHVNVAKTSKDNMLKACVFNAKANSRFSLGGDALQSIGTHDDVGATTSLLVRTLGGPRLA